MWKICKYNHLIIKTIPNSKREHWLSCKQSTANWETPGKVELKGLGWLRALSFPQPALPHAISIYPYHDFLHSGYVITPFRHCALNFSTWEACW